MKYHKMFAWFSFSTLSYVEWTYLRIRKCGNIIIYHELMDISQIIFDASFIINLIFPNLRFMLIRYSWWLLWNNKVRKNISKAFTIKRKTINIIYPCIWMKLISNTYLCISWGRQKWNISLIDFYCIWQETEVW